MEWTSNYALYPANRLLVHTSVRMTLRLRLGVNPRAAVCGRPSDSTPGWAAPLQVAPKTRRFSAVEA
jgi:hypothetical protein